MRNKIKFILFFSIMLSGSVLCNGQNISDTLSRIINKKGSSKYLDDQIFIALTYNFDISSAKPYKSYSFPNTFSFGYIRDIPVTERRNFGFGAGLSFGFHTYYNNFLMSRQENGDTVLEFLNSEQYKNNRFSMQTLEIPLQIRYRTSTAEKFNFWRFYAGITTAWVFKNFSTNDNYHRKVRFYNFSVFKNFIWTANLQIGYGKFTLKADYVFSGLFKNSSEQIKSLNMQNTSSLNVGLIVYLI